MMRRRPLRKLCARCKRLIPRGMVRRAHSVCMPDDWSVCGGIVETTAQKLRRMLWGTEPTTRWLWFILGFALAGLLLAGCATLPNTDALAERHATQAARFADALGPLSAKRSATTASDLKPQSGD